MPSKSKSARPDTSSDPCTMPRWATIWILVGSIVCLWDATYVLSRPRSMANGDLFHIFFPYAKYITLDPLYGNMQNAFVIAQSWMNYVEITLGFVSLIVYHIAGRHNFGCLLLLIVSVMTWSKTVLYFVHDSIERPLHPQQLPIEYATWEYWLLFIVPSLVWVMFPLACMVNITRQIVEKLNLLTRKTKSN